MSGQPCPHCQNTIRLPDPIAPETLLQCPICKRVVRAAQLLSAAEQTWIVVDKETTESELSHSTPQAVASENSSSPSSSDDINNPPPLPRQQDTKEDSNSTPSSGSTAETKTPVPTGKEAPKADLTRRQPIKQQDWSKFKPISHEEFQRKKKKSSSAWLGIIQVVLGGALAIPISLLLIWHVLGKDVGGIGKEVARYIPWIVPRKFHPYRSTSFSDPEPSGSQSSTAKNNSIKRDFEAELAASLAESERKPAGDSPLGSMKLESKSALPEEKTDTPSPTSGVVSKSLPGTPEIAKTTPSDTEVLMQSLASTREAIAAWPSVKDKGADARRKVANEFYSNLARAVEVYAKVADQPSHTVWKQQLSKLAREIVDSPELVQLVRAGGFAKLTLKPAFIKPGVGMALIGSLETPTTDEPSKPAEPEDGLSNSNEIASEPQPDAEKPTDSPDATESPKDNAASPTENTELPKENSEQLVDDFPLSETAAADTPSWIMRIRRNIITNTEIGDTAQDEVASVDPEKGTASSDTDRTPRKNLRLRKAELHPTLLLDSPGNDEYLLFVIAHSATKDGAPATKDSADVIWFAERVDLNPKNTESKE